jgi:hypothetical protein
LTSLETAEVLKTLGGFEILLIHELRLSFQVSQLLGSLKTNETFGSTESIAFSETLEIIESWAFAELLLGTKTFSGAEAIKTACITQRVKTLKAIKILTFSKLDLATEFLTSLKSSDFSKALSRLGSSKTVESLRSTKITEILRSTETTKILRVIKGTRTLETSHALEGTGISESL